jgi:hypothetical protein
MGQADFPQQKKDFHEIRKERPVLPSIQGQGKGFGAISFTKRKYRLKVEASEGRGRV